MSKTLKIFMAIVMACLLILQAAPQVFADQIDQTTDLTSNAGLNQPQTPSDKEKTGSENSGMKEDTDSKDAELKDAESKDTESKDTESKDTKTSTEQPAEDSSEKTGESEENDLDIADLTDPEALKAPAPQENTVTLIGQWTNESRKLKDTTRTYADLNKEIGEPEINGGLLRGLAKTFLGWSDKAPVGNGVLAEGARLYSPHDKIGTVKGFEAGIPADAKLYAVYFSINDPKTPFPESKFGMGLAFLSLKDKLEALVNENTVRINKNILAEDTLLNTANNPSKTNTNQENDNRTIIDYYSKTDDLKKMHEVVLEAEFTMNDTIAMLVYKNPVGSNALRPILSHNYNVKYNNDGFGIVFRENSDYTYMDLVIQLDPKLKLPDDKLYLEFDAYSWRPLYVLDAENNPLNIVDPLGGSDLGKTSSAFKSLVSPSPSTIFAVNLKQAKLINANGDQQITLRTVLREGNNEKIPEKSVVALPGKTIAETILSNMKLRTLTTAEIQSKFGKSVEDSNQSIVRIPDEKASELADTNGEKTLKVTGYIEGYALSSAGLPISPSAVITRKDANTVYLGYTRGLGYFVETHRYETLNEKGEVIDVQIVEKPAQHGYAADSYFTQKELLDGFKLVSVSSPNQAAFAANGDRTSGHFVEGSTLSVEYVYQKAPKPTETTKATKATERTTTTTTTTQKPRKLPQTGERSTLAISSFTLLAGVVLLALRRKIKSV